MHQSVRIGALFFVTCHMSLLSLCTQYEAMLFFQQVHPDRIKDWVTHPKPSGYRAVQLTVMGPDCNWIEIQIRSEQMDYDAEEGAAAKGLGKTL